MYSVFADDLCIYDDISPSESLTLLSPKLTLADNSAGSFTFTMPPTNVGYDSVARMSTVITVKRDDTEIWEGRIISEEMDYWKQRRLTCEGELAYLNDILQPPSAYNDYDIQPFLRDVLANYNAKASSKRQFQLGAVTVNAYTYGGLVPASITTTANYSSTWDVIKSTLLDVYEGHLRVRKSNGVRYLDYLADYPVTNSQEIDFYDNLLDYTSNWEEDELTTVIIPYGKKIEKDESEAKTGLAYKIVKTRNENNNTYDVEFQFTFNNPGVPSDYYVDITESSTDAGTTTQTTKQELGSYDHSIWLWFWPEGNSTHASYTSATTEVWTMKASTKDNKTWNQTITGLSPNVTYHWEAEVRRWRSNLATNQSMGGEFEQRNHTFTVSFTDGELDGIEKYTTIASVNNGSERLLLSDVPDNPDTQGKNQEAYDNFGPIERVVTWDEIDDPQKLKNLAIWYLKDYQFNNMIISVTALDLHYLKHSITAFNFLDQVHVRSIRHGMDRLFPLTKIDIPLDQPENTTFTLGDKEPDSYTKSSTATRNDIYSRLGAVPTTKDMMAELGSAGYRMLVEAQENAAQIIDTHTHGYITITTNATDGNSNELYISETPDYKDSNKFWRWNMGGLGYTKDKGKTYEVAMTMDGSIVANMVKTGQMLVDRIKLYGLMGVFKQSDGVTPGGYIGYGEGEVGASVLEQAHKTSGIMITNEPKVDAQGVLTPDNRRYFIVTEAGVRATADNQRFYLTDNTHGGNGVLIVNNTFTLQASQLDLYPPVDSSLGSKDTALHGVINVGSGFLMFNKGMLIGVGGPHSTESPKNIGGASGNEIQIGKANITLHNGMVTAITPWTAASYKKDIDDILAALRDKVDWTTWDNNIPTMKNWISGIWDHVVDIENALGWDTSGYWGPPW